MDGWTLDLESRALALRIVVALIYSLMFGAIVAVATWFYARRREMTKAEREAEDKEIKDECTF
jgi:Tfp pilus assembly protein PilO